MAGLSAIRLISLDVTNTILKVRGGVGGIYKSVAAQYALLNSTSAENINQKFRENFHRNWRSYPNFGYGEMCAKDWWLTVASDTIRQCTPRYLTELDDRSVLNVSEVLYEVFSTAEPYELIPGARETLYHLAQNYELILLSNNDSRIRNVIRELLPPEMFTKLIISNETGYHKPDTEIFRLAYEGYNTTDYRDILHVGDSYTNDYDAAMRVGVNARLITDKAHPDCPHTHTISSINHLVL